MTINSRLSLVRDGAIAIITLQRPEKLNALDAGMVAGLESLAIEIDANSEIRVCIITGTGEKSFCAGGDIDAWSQHSPHEFGMMWVKQGHRAFDALARMRQPLIAALNGHALGGGLELAATADFRIAEAHIRIGLPETGIGIIPGWSGTQRAVRKFGAQSIRRMSLAGEIFDATECLNHGLVDQVVPKGKALENARDMAGRIIARGAFATSAAKMLINAAEDENAEAAIEAMGGIAAASHDQLKAKVAEFLNRKRK